MKTDFFRHCLSSKSGFLCLDLLNVFHKLSTNIDCTCFIRDIDLKDDLKKPREERSPKSSHHSHRNGRVDLDVAQKTPLVRYGELIILG